MKFSPLLYDFKRGILRVPVLVVLAVAALAGVGLAYLLSYVLTMGNIAGVFHASYMLLDLENNEVIIEGAFYTGSGRAFTGEVEYRVYCYSSVAQVDIFKHRGRYTGEFSSRLSVEFPIKTLSEDYTCRMESTFDTPLGRVTGNYTAFIVKHGNSTLIYGVVSNYPSKNVVTSSLHAAGNETPSGYIALNAIRPDPGIRKHVVLYGLLVFPLDTNREFILYLYELEKMPEEHSTPIPLPTTTQSLLKPHVVDRLKHGLFKAEIDLDSESSEILWFYLVSKDMAYSSQGVLPLRSMVEAFITALATTGSLSIFTMLLSVVAFYLVYIYIAKPRSQGALEFIIARPVTRFDLYVTRYVAGVLVLTISATVLYSVFTVVTYVLLSIEINPYVHLILIGGLILSLVAFYSLCYFMSMITSGTRYILVAVFIYIFFVILFNVVVLLVYTAMRGGLAGIQAEEYTRMRYFSQYFTPLGMVEFASYYVFDYYGLQLQYGVETSALRDIVSPWSIALSSTMWILLPVVTGWYIFRKANLAR